MNCCASDRTTKHLVLSREHTIQKTSNSVVWPLRNEATVGVAACEVKTKHNVFSIVSSAIRLCSDYVVPLQNPLVSAFVDIRHPTCESPGRKESAYKNRQHAAGLVKSCWGCHRSNPVTYCSVSGASWKDCSANESSAAGELMCPCDGVRSRGATTVDRQRERQASYRVRAGFSRRMKGTAGRRQWVWEWVRR